MILAAYERLQAHLPDGVEQVDTADPNAEWAVTARRDAATTGHSE